MSDHAPEIHVRLTDDDRAKFCRWLEWEIHSNNILLEQMKKLKLGAIAKHKAAQTQACEIVLRLLQNTESFTVR